MRKLILAAGVLTALLMTLSAPGKIFAAACDNTIKGSIQCGAGSSSGVPVSNDPQQSLNDTIGTIINDLSVVAGIISVVMIIIAGVRFATSGGDATKVATARKTVIYALIGLSIAVLAKVIAKFVIGKAVGL